MFKNRGSPDFYSLKDQKYYKNWIKETVFVHILGFSYYSVSHAATHLHK